MQNYIQGTVMVILYLGLSIVLPIWVIRRLYLWAKRRGKTRPKRKYKVISLPIILLNAIPGFVGFLTVKTDISINEDIFGILMAVTGIITIVHAIIQCRLAGLWIGPIRFILGLMVGISAGVAIILVLGLLLVIGYSESSDESDRIAKANRKLIYRNGRAYEVHRIGNSDNYSDPETGETLRDVDGRYFINKDGHSFEMRD